MAKFRMSYRQPNISRVVAKIAGAVIALYVGGEIMTQLGTVMNGTTSAFYTGLTLIGWTVSSNQITATTGSGILGVIGIIAIAGIVLEFVKFRM